MIVRPDRLSILLFALLAVPASGYQSRLLDPSGAPVPAAQISVVGRSGSVRTAADGSFEIVPDPALPSTLIVVGSRGEIYPPIHLETLAAEVRLEPAWRETVTVTTGAAPNIEGTPAAAPVVVGAEEIEQRKPAHVAEAIAAMPGVTIRGEGPPAVPVVRGLAGGRTLLLIDDARVVSERRAGPSASFLDPLTLGSIEISRGPGSVAYGSDALGGVVHMRPRDPVPGSPASRYDAWFSFGGTNERSVAAETSFDVFGGAMLGAIHVRTADDAVDGSGETIENSRYRDRGALLRFVRDTPSGRLRVGLMSSVARDTGAPSSEASRTTYPDERATLATFAADLQPGGWWTAAFVRGSLGAHSLTTARERPGGAIESAAVKARDASLRLSGERGSGASRFVTGVDFVSRFDLRASGSIDDAGRTDVGAWATWEGRVLPAVQLVVGGRGDRIDTRNRGGWFGDRSRDDVALSGHAAATAGPFRGATATLQVARGFREPMLSDRYFRGVSGRGFITGNPDLEPEKSLQFDAALRWTGGRTRAALFAYDYRITDLVERYRDGTDFFFRNRGEAEIRGVEAELAATLPRNLEIQAGASLARGESEGGEPLDDISPPALHLSLRWAAERASSFATLSAFARDDRPGPVEVERPGYVSLDIGAGWRISPRFELRLAVRNATDAHRFGSPDENAAFAPGRSVMVGINR